MKKCLLFFCAFVTQQMLFAQFVTPNTIDGTISANEYGTHTDGNNQQSTNSLTWYLTWDNTYLYVAAANYNQSNDALVFYIDHNPLAVVNGGSNTDGSLTGTGYDGLATTLPFRADFFGYLKPGYDDYKYHNSAGGWGNSTTASLLKSTYTQGTSTVFEVRIPWTAVTNGGLRPASFNFVCFGGYSTGLYSQVPSANPTGTMASVTLPYYFTVSSTANSSSTKPFSQVSYATNTGSSTLSSASNLWDFTLNSSTATLTATHNISGVATVTGVGTLTTNGNLTLKSTASNTASLAAVSGTITGNVICEKYIAGGGLSTALPSKRAFRFLAHPFTASLNLNAITGAGEIDITGTGGVTNGFTASSSNNASAFKYDAAAATSSTNPGLQNGWVAYTSANGGTGNTWDQYKGVRVFYRGAKGEGLTGSAYTVGNATISMTGALNAGTQIIPLTYNTTLATGFNLVGNPYASNVQMSGVTSFTTTTAYYVWNLALGNRGGYTTVIFGSAYVLPAYASIFVAASNTGGTVTFNQNNKTTSAPSNTLLRTTNNAKKLTLQLKSDDVLWDELQLQFDAAAKASKEWADGDKLQNPDVSLYSLSSDNVELAIDKRPLKDGDIINLGLLTNAARSFSFVVTELDADKDLFLQDSYNNTLQKLELNGVYSFTTTADAASQGNSRFQIMQKSRPVLALLNDFSMRVSPNPTSDKVTVRFTNSIKANTTISIANAEGKIVKMVELGNVQTGETSIKVNGLAKGNYYVLLTNGTETKTEKLQIQ